MKTNKYIMVTMLLLSIFSCQKVDFETAYSDPSKIAVTSTEKQFSGFLQANTDYVLPSYWNYFVILRITLNRYNQAVGWANGDNQYIPGSAAVGDRWSNYYGFLSQYRELEKVYNSQSSDEKADKRIYMIAATTYLYDHTQKVIDLHGDIPFSEAGKLSTNGGDYSKSYAKYDKGDEVYKKMLDDLKTFADELGTMTIKPAILTGFKTQDYVNNGNIDKWKKYVNSLRLRMLTRVSAASAFSARAKTEIAEILSNKAKYPIVESNADNIQINVFNVSTPINSSGFRSGLEDWNGNIAGKKMIDHMNTNGDPRLRILFEPGEKAEGKYNGLDPMLNSAVQTEQINSNTLAIYNRSTLSRNRYFPGVLITAAEVNLLASEYYLTAGNDAMAKTQYESSITNSIEFYSKVRAISDDATAGSLTPVTESETKSYIAASGIDWSKAANQEAKMGLIANQKWIHFNVVQPNESWAELRRHDALKLNFWVDNSNKQTLPPLRWFYPGSEQSYNTKNYDAVRSTDLLTSKLFWDTK